MRSGGIGPSEPVIEVAIGPSGEVRASPRARAVLSRARSVPRGGSLVSRVSFSPRRSPGKTRSWDQSTPASVTGTRTVPRTGPQMRVSTRTGMRYASPSRFGRPVTTLTAVAVSRARWYARVNAPRRMRARSGGESSLYIAG